MNFTLKDRTEFGAFLNAHGLLGEGVEVGVHQGVNARSIIASWQGRMLHLVDPWKATPRFFDNEIAQLVQEFEPRIIAHRALSLDAAPTFQDEFLDFVYIDADHTYEAVLADLKAWYPKVRHGGILCGHDYDGNAAHNGWVRQAVNEFGIEITVTRCTSFWHFKP